MDDFAASFPIKLLTVPLSEQVSELSNVARLALRIKRNPRYSQASPNGSSVRAFCLGWGGNPHFKYVIETVRKDDEFVLFLGPE